MAPARQAPWSKAPPARFGHDPASLTAAASAALPWASSPPRSRGCRSCSSADTSSSTARLVRGPDGHDLARGDLLESYRQRLAGDGGHLRRHDGAEALAELAEIRVDLSTPLRRQRHECELGGAAIDVALFFSSTGWARCCNRANAAYNSSAPPTGAAISSAWPPVMGALARISPCAAAIAAGTPCVQRGSDAEIARCPERKHRRRAWL